MLNVLNVLDKLKMPKDPSLACWALFFCLSICRALAFGSIGSNLCFVYGLDIYLLLLFNKDFLTDKFVSYSSEEIQLKGVLLYFIIK